MPLMNNVVNNKPQTAIFSKIRGQPNHSEMQRQLRKVSVHDESRSLHCVYTQKSQRYNDWKQGKLYLLQKYMPSCHRYVFLYFTDLPVV